jgi:hypothetical protein
MKMKRLIHALALVLFLSLLMAPPSHAEGIVSKVVNSPLSATGLVKGARVGINIYLQSKAAHGIEFMNPEVIGYGIPAGGRIEIELAKGYERDPKVPIAQKTIMVVTGTPQQGMPGKAVGYRISQGANPNTIVLSPAKKNQALKAASLMSPAPGAKGDPVRQRGIKVFHVGLLQSAFINKGIEGTIYVRIINGKGKVAEKGRATVKYMDKPVPQIHPNNFPNRQRSHNWQQIKPGQTLGVSPGTLPIPVMLFEQAKGVPPAKMVAFKKGILGAGVVSTQQLRAMKYKKPAELSRYNGGLILQDTNGDGRLDPKVDRIIGGIIGKAPKGAKGQELKSLNVHGAIDLSRPSSAYHAKLGKIFGGAVMLLQFTSGNKMGLYRPTLALLKNPGDPSSGDDSIYTFTIEVK